LIKLHGSEVILQVAASFSDGLDVGGWVEDGPLDAGRRWHRSLIWRRQRKGLRIDFESSVWAVLNLGCR
jgi:hypothetical protein